MSYNSPPPNYGQPGYYGGAPGNNPANLTYEQKAAIRARRQTALRKVGTHGVVLSILAILAIGSGIAVLVVASDNVAFPTFNFGPVIVGLVALFGGVMALQAARKGSGETSDALPSGSVKCYFVGHFAVCVTCISLAVVSGVFSLLAAGVCFDPDEVISHNRRGEKVNLSEACEPNKTGNAIAGLVAGIVCILIAVLCIFGTCFLCCYGPAFGFTNRRRRMRMLEQRIAQMEMQAQAPPVYSTGQPGYGEGPGYKR